MAGLCELGGMKGEGLMSGEEGADQWMSSRGVCMGMQMNERDSKREERYELRDHQEHPNWDKWAVCQVHRPLIGVPLQPMLYSERSSCLKYIARQALSTMVGTRSPAGDDMTLHGEMPSLSSSEGAFAPHHQADVPTHSSGGRWQVQGPVRRGQLQECWAYNTWMPARARIVQPDHDCCRSTTSGNGMQREAVHSHTNLEGRWKMALHCLATPSRQAPGRNKPS